MALAGVRGWCGAWGWAGRWEWGCNGPSSPSSAPLTFKDGTALGLSCMADYGAPVFPFLAVGGYKGELGSSGEAARATMGQEREQ